MLDIIGTSAATSEITMFWDYCKKCGWQTEIPRIEHNSRCPKCRSHMARAKITWDEYYRNKKQLERLGMKAYLDQFSCMSRYD